MSSSPHDALFKAIFSDLRHARAELESVLPPELAARIDWDSLALVPGSFVDEALAKSESDLLFEAGVVGGGRVRLHLLFEHQSTVDPRMPFRLLKYMVRIWERDDGERLVPIVPVVLHHSETGWTASTSFEALVELGSLAGTGIESYVPRFSFVLDDVSARSDEEIAHRTVSAVVRLTLATLREARRTGDAAMVVMKLGALLREVVGSESGNEAYLRVLRYILSVAGPDDPRPFFEALTMAVGTERKDEAMGLLDTLVERGRQEGRLAGGRETLLQLLELRFGPLAEPARARVLAMDAGAFEAALERTATASRLEDVLPAS